MTNMRINVIVAEDAHQILVDFQHEHKYKNRDNALEDLLREYKRLSEKKKN